MAANQITERASLIFLYRKVSTKVGFVPIGPAEPARTARQSAHHRLAEIAARF